MDHQGKLIIISAPSGAGKTTIVKCLLEKNDFLEFSISACTRQKRQEEIDGKDYYFLSKDEFKNKIENNEFLEWEEVYKDHYYGTLLSELDRIWEQEKHVIFDVDVVGGLNIKKAFPDRARSIFIKPPSLEVLEQRLESRASDSAESLAIRKQKAEDELNYEMEFDEVIVNDDLEIACNKAQKILADHIR
ncbi:MAG: guanylate kinase [Bacteroidetes bacterium]|nr:guanylate kinase [Bacteroidia bacterium]PCH69259.1 MAG: guanylate kinase [Bacteroidota bacterium]